jgi:hypothetical protein
MRTARGLFGACLVFCAAGCNIVPPRYQLAATPLMDAPGTPVPPGNPPAPGSPTGPGVPTASMPTGGLTPIQWVNVLVQDSQTKCAEFVNSLFAQTAGSGLLLDILNTTSSALATVFTPLSTVHALTAASTIFGGARTSITAEYLNSLTISHISQAIQSTYSSDMQKYIAWLDTADPATIDVFHERSRIVSYHNECSLASAEGSIGSALQPPAQVGQASPLSITYKIGTARNDTTLSGLTTAIIAAVNGDPTFNKAGVTASLGGPGVISLNTTKPFNFTPTVLPPDHTESVEIVNGSPARLTIAGKLRQGDIITITGIVAAQQSGGAPIPPPSGGGPAPSASGTPVPPASVAPIPLAPGAPPPAATLGVAPEQK